MSLGNPIKSINRVSEERRKLVTSLVNGFDFTSLNGSERHYLRRRALVNHTGTVTDKGRAWAREFLAWEADKLIGGGSCLDFEE